MTSPHLTELHRFATVEMPSLRHDVHNAVTPLSIREVNIKMFSLMERMLHHMILESVDRLQDGQPSAPLPPPPPRPAAPPFVPAPIRTLPRPATPAAPAGLAPLPPLLDPGQVPFPTSPALPGSPDRSVQPGVANVFVTTSGTQVITPDGAQVALPPGAAVDLAATTGQPELPPPPEGGVNVVLPPGGGLTPEVAAALAGRLTPPA